MPTVSLFPKISVVNNGQELDLDIFLEYIRDGKWQDDVFAVRTGKKEKSELPYATISGTFKHRSVSGLLKHSGFLAMDVDDIDVEEVKSRVCTDKYVYAAFTSVSGKGLCLIFKINSDKHLDAFEGLQEYLFNNYDIVCDPSCKDVSRPRFISFDPHIFINSSAPKFTIYPEKKAPTKVPTVIFAQTDFDELIKEIQSRGLNMCEDYGDWLRIGFALCDKFGEFGRSYFHIVSSQSGKYDLRTCDRQYDNCLKARGMNKHTSIATFYYYCKQAGLNLYSQRTKTITNAALNAKKGGRTKEQAMQTLSQFADIRPDESEDIVSQVFDSAIEGIPEMSTLERLEQYLKQEYSFKRNEITRKIESGDKEVQKEEFNDIWLCANKIIGKIPFEHVERIILSNITPTYNPLKEWFYKRENEQITIGHIDALFDTMLSDDFEYTRHYGKKWLVSVVASIFGYHSPLMLVLSGSKQGAGKTEFFRRMIPIEFKKYYGEIKQGMKDNDLNLLMTQKFMLLDDECGNKTKKDEIALKSLLSTDMFSLREPYGKSNVDLKRLSVLCGTTNEEEILSDPTGNRRIIPIKVYGINHDDYNNIDKEALFMEAYWLYKSGFKYELNNEDIEKLNKSTTRFESHNAEYELIYKYFEKPLDGDTRYVDELSTTEIKIHVENQSGIKNISIRTLGQQLKRMGFEQNMKYHRSKGTQRLWSVIKLNSNPTSGINR
jgi:predicted P-loop ATPase